MGHALDQRPAPRRPLSGTGPSRDQPAPGSPRHIPAGSPEPPPTVTAVAVLEQAPSMERWVRVGPDRWRHEGYRGRLTASAQGAEDRVVPWSKVGVCSHGTRHAMKDVTGRAAAWDDRPEDLLPELRWVVQVQVQLAAAAPDWERDLRKLYPRLCVVERHHDSALLDIPRDAPTVMAAVTAVGRGIESVHGLRVTGVHTTGA